MKKLLLLLWLSPMAVQAQFMVSASAGMGTFRMKQMKQLQLEVKREFPVEPKTISSFPPFWIFELTGIKVTDDHFFTGAGIGFGSTGGREFYSDYSGRISFDQLLNFISISGAIGGITTAEKGKWIIQGDLKPALILTNLKLILDEEVGGQQSHESLSFSGLNLSIEPTAIVTKKFGIFGLYAYAGYNVTLLAGKLYYDENDEVYLTGDDGKEIAADWSGLRAGMGVNVTINY